MSICAWLKVLGDGSHADGIYVLSKGQQGSQPYMSYRIGYSPANDYIYSGFAVSSSMRSVVSDSLFSPPTGWIFVCASYDGSGVVLYVNGLKQKTVPIAGTIDYGLPDDDLHIGDWGYPGYERRFEGLIDEVSIWNRTLSEEEVQGLYSRGAPIECAGCVHEADKQPCDGCIDFGELLSYIDLWKQNQVAIADLMEAIGIWKDGC